jgi:uncharacterized membrane protein
MAKKKQEFMSGAKFGHWIFLAGVFIAIVAGILAGVNTTVIWVLALLGLIVGLINITLSDEVPFLVATTVLLIASGSLNVIPIIGDTIGTILAYIVVFVAPAGLVVALKAVYAFARA